MKILFVCTGNICRSPAAEAVLRKMSGDLPWSADSAGCSNFHCGEAPDRRATAAATRRGYDMSSLRARAVCREDFRRFEIIYAMAREHLRLLREMAPANGEAEIKLFRRDGGDVSDPYYGGEAGFDEMMDLIEEECRAIVKEYSRP